MPEPKHPTCVETTARPGRPEDRTYVCGVNCPAPQAEEEQRVRARDARRRVAAEDARRAAARALDRYLTRWLDEDPEEEPVTSLSEQFVEAVGDYVVSRLQHSGHYGVPGRCDGCGAEITAHGFHPDGMTRCPDAPRNPDYVVTDASAVHVPHLHKYEASPCLKVECHELNADEYCTWCGGQPCRVVLAPQRQLCSGGLNAHRLPATCGRTVVHPAHYVGYDTGETPGAAPCPFAYVYDMGKWSWLALDVATRGGLKGRRCSKSGGHPGPHMPGPDRVDVDPCASGRCADPAAHAEGAHDV